MSSAWELSACIGKTRFDSYRVASKTLKRRARNQDTQRNVYRCHHCGGYHIGTNPPQKRRPVKHFVDEETTT